MSLLSDAQPFAVSLLIGLAAGIDRERSAKHNGNIMGVRTFALLAILGTTVAYIGLVALTAVVSLFVAGMVAIGYWRSTTPHGEASGKGLTTEVAACLVFILGYLTAQKPLLAGVLGILVVAVLYYRSFLHHFAKDVIKPKEITAALILVAFVFILVPSLPDERIDPWQLFNPRMLAQVVALIAAVEFFGYIAHRIFGAKKGALVAGFFGGLASSTATVLAIAKRQRAAPTYSRLRVGEAMMATSAPLLLYLLIIASTSSGLMRLAGLPVFVAAALSAGLGVVAARRAGAGDEAGDGPRSPLDFKGVVTFGTLLVMMLVASAAASRQLGESGVEVVSFLGGLFELHGITLANASLHAAGELADGGATMALLLAVIASIVSKIGISWAIAPGRFAVTITMLMGLLIAAGALTYKAVGG